MKSPTGGENVTQLQKLNSSVVIYRVWQAHAQFPRAQKRRMEGRRKAPPKKVGPYGHLPIFGFDTLYPAVKPLVPP
jgi:hypothetical protein